MHCQLVNNLHGQYFVMVRQHHWPPGVPRQHPVYIDDEWSARIFIRLLDIDAHQWRHWVDHTYVDLRYGESAFISAAIRELAQGRFSIFPIKQEEFLRTIPKACTFQNHRDPDDQHHEYAIIPSAVAMVKPDYDAVPLLIARRLLQAWAVTAGNEQLKQMLTLLQLRHGKADAMEELLAALLEGLNSGGICLVRIRRRSPSVAAKKPEFLPFVHRPVPLGPPAPLSQPGPAPGPVSLYTPALAQDEEFRAANVLNPSDQSIEDKVSALDEKSAKVVKIGGGIDSLLGKAYVRARGYRVHAKEMNSAVGVGIISDKKGNLSLSPASHRIPVDGVYANPNNHAPTVLDIDATKAIYILERAPHTFYQKGYYGRDYQWLSNAFEAIVIVETTASNELDFVSIYHPGASQPTEYPEGLN